MLSFLLAMIIIKITAGPFNLPRRTRSTQQNILCLLPRTTFAPLTEKRRSALLKPFRFSVTPTGENLSRQETVSWNALAKLGKREILKAVLETFLGSIFINFKALIAWLVQLFGGAPRPPSDATLFITQEHLAATMAQRAADLSAAAATLLPGELRAVISAHFAERIARGAFNFVDADVQALVAELNADRYNPNNLTL